jgi:hypothetical protein
LCRSSNLTGVGAVFNASGDFAQAFGSRASAKRSNDPRETARVLKELLAGVRPLMAEDANDTSGYGNPAKGSKFGGVGCDQHWAIM